MRERRLVLPVSAILAAALVSTAIGCGSDTSTTDGRQALEDYVAAVQDVPDELRAAQDAYAHTFVLQDTYLSALAAALPGRQFDELPDFQNEQRVAIIAWRTRLQVLADRWGATLPADLQAAGRGEISPSPTGD